MMDVDDDSGHRREQDKKSSKKEVDLYPVIKSSQGRKRGYSDVDQSNVEAL